MSADRSADASWILLGALERFSSEPTTVPTPSGGCFVTRTGETVRALSAICPHQGGHVHDAGATFECPVHGWRFDRDTGRCLNAPSRSLRSVPVRIEGGFVFAQIHDERLAVPSQGLRVKPGLSIQLHAHACLEIAHDGFTLLTDPWLDGPAFLGAWLPYPVPLVTAADLHPDAILLTHEHSDHFHEATLRGFDRRTPMYFPDFPNQRMGRRLAALGFTDLRAIRFGEDTLVHPGWRVVAFEPESYWNDALVLIEVDGYRIFDINDAGINARIARMVAPVDLLAVQFSAGASGYPWTWSHLSDDEKVAISKTACAGKLKMIRDAAALYGAAAVLPFASHFTLWHPDHQRYAQLMRRNRLADVKDAMSSTGVAVVDLLPGDWWDAGEDRIHRGGLDEDARDPGWPAAYWHSPEGIAAFQASHPSGARLARDELMAYLDQLNGVPEIQLTEDLSVCLEVSASTAGQPPMVVAFEIAAGRLRFLPVSPDRPNLRISIPAAVLAAVIRDELSWDEAFIGYWCRFDRYPDVYHAGFWRLLQAPYLRRTAAVGDARPGRITGQSVVAEVLEAVGAPADRVLRRYGLYCRGCEHSVADSIEMAARQHGVDAHRVDALLKELNVVAGRSADDLSPAP